jgi:MoxR-like ATPase
MGKVAYNAEKKEQVLEKGVVFTNLLLVDEINRAQPKTQSALLEAMGEKSVTLGGVTYQLPQPFTVIATQNPVEQEGTFPLPEAQSDRFMFKSVLKYLPMEDEMLVLKSKLAKEKIGKVFNPPEILIIKEEIKNSVSISDSLLEYILRIVDGTRKRREVQTGGSTRASISLMESSKAKAFFEGRDCVTVKDIKELTFPVLRHRIILNPDSRDFGVTTDDIISKVLEHVEAPVE